MNSSFRTAFWAMCLGLSIPMAMFVGWEVATGGRAARRAVAGSAAAAALQERPQAGPAAAANPRPAARFPPGDRQRVWESRASADPRATGPAAPPPGEPADSLAASSAPGNESATIDGAGQAAAQPRPSPAPPELPRVVLRPELETDPTDDERPRARARPVAAGSPPRATPTGVEPALAPAAVGQLEDRLSRIELGLARLEQTAARAAADGLSPELLRQSLELIGKSLESRQASTAHPADAPRPQAPAGGGEAPKLISRIYRPRYIQTLALQALVRPLLTPELGKMGVAAPDEAPHSPFELEQAPREWEALVIHDTPEVLRKIDRLFDRVDLPPRHVVLETTLLLVAWQTPPGQGIDLRRFAGTAEEPSLLPLNGRPAAAAPRNPMRAAADNPVPAAAWKAGVLQVEPDAWIAQFEAAHAVAGRAAHQTSVRNRAELPINLKVEAGAGTRRAPVNLVLHVRSIVTRDDRVHLEIRPADSFPGSANVLTLAAAGQIVLQPGQSFVCVAPLLRVPSVAGEPAGLGDAPGQPSGAPAGQQASEEFLLVITPRLKQPAATVMPGQQSLPGPAIRPRRPAG